MADFLVVGIEVVAYDAAWLRAFDVVASSLRVALVRWLNNQADPDRARPWSGPPWSGAPWTGRPVVHG